MQQRSIVIDCLDPTKAVGFWRAALGWVERQVNEQYVSLTSPDGELGLPFLFQVVPERKELKNRMHLDFSCEDRAAEILRLRSLGATVPATRSLGDFTWTVMADPEGNEFCVD